MSARRTSLEFDAIGIRILKNTQAEAIWLVPIQVRSAATPLCGAQHVHAISASAGVLGQSEDKRLLMPPFSALGKVTDYFAVTATNSESKLPSRTRSRTRCVPFSSQLTLQLNSFLKMK
jgi:hypothetical protein